MDYLCMARTNYVKVTDPAEFGKVIIGMGGTVINMEVMRGNGSTAVYGGIGAMWGDGQGPYIPDDEEGWEDIYDPMDAFKAKIAPTLAPGEVIVYMESGHEGGRYANGYAFATNASGKQVHMNLNEIYDRAKALTDRPDDITFAEY